MDDSISREILNVVRPAAVEAALQASDEESRIQQDVFAALERDLEAARYAVNRAQRQYDAADPENRLVTGELERRWNSALNHVHELELRIQTFRANAAAPS